jgi:hypothetical protein
MLRFIKYRAKGTAEKRSKELWSKAIGKPVARTSTTKYLYDFAVSKKIAGGSYLFIHDDGALLNASEKKNLEEKQWSAEDFAAWLDKYVTLPS